MKSGMLIAVLLYELIVIGGIATVYGPILGALFITTVPFLIEGIVQGVAGGALAVGLLYGLYRVMLPALSQGLSFVIGYAQPAFLTSDSALWLVAGGAALGVLGSAAALAQGMRE